MKAHERWVGVSGSWRTSCAALETDLGREIKRLVNERAGICTGGALGVDFAATEIALAANTPLRVIIPTSLDVYARHYRARAHEGVITRVQALALITQLTEVHRRGQLEQMEHDAVDKDSYYARNAAIVERSTELLAFQVNRSAGCQDTIDRALAAGMHVHLFRYTL